MGYVLTDYGEDYTVNNGLDSGTVTWDVGLYDDASSGTTGDSISDSSTLSSITTEPAGSNYARQSDTFSPADKDGSGEHDATDNDNQLSFDTSDSSAVVDSWFLVINFQSNSQTAAEDNLVATGALSQEYDLSNVDTLNIDAGTVGVQVD